MIDEKNDVAMLKIYRQTIDEKITQNIVLKSI